MAGLRADPAGVTPPRLRLLAVLALLALPALAAPAAPAAPGSPQASAARAKGKAKLTPLRPVKGRSRVQVGIADQKPTAFDDARFARLGLRHARRSVAWDALQHDWQAAEIDAWLQAVRAAGAEPLVTFARSRIDAKRHRVPTARQFEHEFRRFRQRWPWVRSYSAWNEANHCGEGTCRRPQLVASYYRVIRRGCPGCKVLAADLLDMPNMISWVRAFKKAAKVEPRYWGLHNYVTANRFQTARTRALLQHTKGEVWITETGGLVARRNRSAIKLPQGTRHAAKVTRFIFQRLARLDRRVTRVYLYHWDSTSRGDTWDSAFVGPDGRRRPALAVLERIVRDLRPATAPKRGPAAPGAKKSPVALRASR